MLTEHILDLTTKYVKDVLKDAEGGHDWFHTQRVFNNALHISQTENVNVKVVALAALLHDIADSKFHNGDESLGPKMARTFLFKNNVDSEIIEHVVAIIENMSFKNSFDKDRSFISKELDVVQDADRLDAIGAIGIARAFNYGGYKNRTLYDPQITPNLNMSKEEYKSSKTPTVNHFYEKLLLLKDQMKTDSARKIAEKRHLFMKDYLKQFFLEWEGKA